MIQVAPSLLAADFSNLEKQIAFVNDSEASMLHLDVMDGVFVPNISFGFPVIKVASRLSTKPLDVHLMVVQPEKWIDHMKDAGADIMNVHFEASSHLHRTIEAIIEAGMKPAVTLNPTTPVDMLRDIIGELYMVLLMSVDPGFGGQEFIPNTLRKIDRLKELIAATGSSALIEVDGGINETTGRLASEHGADILVAGSKVFNSPNPVEMISRLSRL
ncbi:MAG: ribulose-phosphate 3-epimerase [Muribaculaceae bacterium]|nr:ribulose-phosphate 3-epimerase [Muribaculaceae bacterium]